MNIHDYFETQAKSKSANSGEFAIAYAIMCLADHQKKTAEALDRMGMWREGTQMVPGALEKISMVLEEFLRRDT